MAGAGAARGRAAAARPPPPRCRRRRSGLSPRARARAALVAAAPATAPRAVMPARCSRASASRSSAASPPEQMGAAGDVEHQSVRRVHGGERGVAPCPERQDMQSRASPAGSAGRSTRSGAIACASASACPGRRPAAAAIPIHRGQQPAVARRRPGGERQRQAAGSAPHARSRSVARLGRCNARKRPDAWHPVMRRLRGLA